MKTIAIDSGLERAIALAFAGIPPLVLIIGLVVGLLAIAAYGQRNL